MNRDTAAAWKYHNSTKHSYSSIRTALHQLDWANKPLEYKIYPTLSLTRLSYEGRPTGVAAMSALAAPKDPAATDREPDLETLAQILFLSAGITKKKKYPGGEIFFRAAACTGALYEIELYLVCGDLRDFPAGVYHFGVAEFGLRQLRAGDYRRTIAEFAGNESSILQAPVILVCSGTYWRNAWKYQARTYRHFGWDNGTILANLLALGSALALPTKVVAGFIDQSLNDFLGLDTRREVTFSLLSLGRRPTEAPRGMSKIPALELALLSASKAEVDYPLMREMHQASSLLSPEEVAAWRGHVPTRTLTAESEVISLPRVVNEPPTDQIEQVIIRRGSTRKFARAPISQTQLSILLQAATGTIPADFLDGADRHLNDLYVIVNDVEDVAPGGYVYLPDQHALKLLRQGNFRKMAGYLALEQELAAFASVCIFFLADLNTVFNRFGNRGYRAVQLEAGIMGGKLYIAAYAQHLGATGLTFYDDDVTRFFSPHAEGKSAIFLVAAGRSAFASEAHTA